MAVKSFNVVFIWLALFRDIRLVKIDPVYAPHTFFTIFSPTIRYLLKSSARRINMDSKASKIN
jgi:hypothetical protein